MAAVIAPLLIGGAACNEDPVAPAKPTDPLACTMPTDCGSASICFSVDCRQGRCARDPLPRGIECDGGHGALQWCDGLGNCLPGNCADTVRNNAETDIDCGGGQCAGCAEGQSCKAEEDCLSGRCGPDATCIKGPAEGAGGSGGQHGTGGGGGAGGS